MFISARTTERFSKSIAKVGDTTAIGVDPFIGGHPQDGKIIQGFVGTIYEVLAVERAVTEDEVKGYLTEAFKYYPEDGTY